MLTYAKVSYNRRESRLVVYEETFTFLIFFYRFTQNLLKKRFKISVHLKLLADILCDLYFPLTSA